ncbi:MAG: V-type ATP synthase subunit F [Candidatus Ornithomonoglobus sp.]
MYKIAVIGDRTSVYGFAALGLDTYFVTDADEAVKLIKRLEREEYAVIYITEAVAAEIPGELKRIAQQPIPAVIPIPGVQGNNGMGMDAVRDNIIKAVGSDI